MRRRSLVAGAAAGMAVLPSAGRAQQRGVASPASVLIVGAVPGSLAPQGLRRGLEELGYAEGRNLTIREHAADAAELAAALAKQPANVIFAIASKGIAAAQRATATVPIVGVDLESEPVADGLVKGLARPGGNLTGLFLDQPALAAKWLQLIGEMVPGLSRLAVLWDPELAIAPLRAIEGAARQMQVTHRTYELRVATLEATFGEIAAYRPMALVILSSPLVVANRATIAGLALAAGIPSITLFRVYAEAGGLMAYGPSPYELGMRAARHVDRILAGAAPADMPIEQPTSFELVVNLKTARTLGLAIPPSILARADEVIE